MLCQLHDLGLIDYDSAWHLQDQLAAEVAAGTRPPTLLLLEHPHTYTFGRSGKSENLLWSEAELAERGVTVRWVDRGGDITYHGPGQLVGYPLIPLAPAQPRSGSPATSELRGERKGRVEYLLYLRNLEKVLINALARLGLAAGQMKGLTGVWVQADIASRCPRCRPEDREKPAKIAAIGVKVDAQGVTRHGFALNVAPDMDYFAGIVPCGLADHPVVSLEDLLETVPPMERVKQEVGRAFGETFGFKMISQPLELAKQE
jgi:lipoyl(octanoyl) transferase